MIIRFNPKDFWDFVIDLIRSVVIAASLWVLIDISAVCLLAITCILVACMGTVRSMLK